MTVRDSSSVTSAVPASSSASKCFSLTFPFGSARRRNPPVFKEAVGPVKKEVAGKTGALEYKRTNYELFRECKG
jgi:hypothetical protein